MKKVLVVDDTKNIRTLLTTCLELNNFNVVTAIDGFEALNLLKKEKFDLAFLDIKLPEMSGTEVLRRMRKIDINIPVVIMTAFATVKNAVECTKLGAVAYLQKPFTADKVKNVLKELCISQTDNSQAIISYLEKSKELISSGSLDESYNVLKKALSIDPTFSETYYLIGKIFEYRNNIDEANKFYSISQKLK